MPDRQSLVDPLARPKRWQFLIILCVIALAYVSCSDATQLAIPFRGETAQSPHITKGGKLPLTNSEPAQGDITPTVLASPPPRGIRRITTPTTLPIPTASTSYEAEAPGNTLAGGAIVARCSVCSGERRVAYIGLNDGIVGTLQFNNITKNVSGQYTLTIYYIIAGSDKLALYISVNGGPEEVLNVASTANGDTIGIASVAISLHAGNNTIEFSNPSDPAPDIDRIVV
jgi:hypothetical protein